MTKFESNDQKSLFKELQDQKEALDHAAIVAATDRAGLITYVNANFCRISEYTAEELLGQSHRIINSSVHSKDFFIDLWKVISEGRVWRGDICNKAKSGKLYWVKTTIVPFLNWDGSPYQYLSIRQDITDLKAAEKIILDQQTKMVSASKLSALGELSSALTHEINNPLAVILGRAEMILAALSGPNPSLDNIRSMVESIQVTSQRIEKIMRTVRALSHGGESEPLQQVSVVSLVESALDVIGHRIRANGIEIRVNLADAEKKMTCRPTEIFQILVNLLSNADDAVQGKDHPWISISSEPDPTGVLLRITDCGVGLSEDVSQKLFSPFFTTKRVGVGTGLGLTISNSLAVRNGARLFHDSTKLNTSFCLVLPQEGPDRPRRA
jgi:PAS domain S-box-containing protein